MTVGVRLLCLPKIIWMMAHQLIFVNELYRTISQLPPNAYIYLNFSKLKTVGVLFTQNHIMGG